MNIVGRLCLAVAILVALVFVGTAGFHYIEGWAWFDGFYMTLTTMATVGYGEIHPLSQSGRIFNSFLIFFGVSVTFLALGSMTQILIELELGEFFDKRRIKRMIDKMQNHFIICGFGRVGRGAAEELAQADVPFVVIDRDAGRVESAIKAGMSALM